jgi:hypothetical protein
MIRKSTYHQFDKLWTNILQYFVIGDLVMLQAFVDFVPLLLDTGTSQRPLTGLL